MDNIIKSGVPAIQMEDLASGSMRDPTTIVVENVNWTVEPGDYWVLAGLQGSGKSDFLMMTAGLMQPTGGSYRLFGVEMPIFEEARMKDRLRLGLVFDGGQLFNHLTVRENIALPLQYHKHLSSSAAEPEVSRMIEAMGLAEWADRPPSAIGRNWQKRAGLARALMLEPDVLLVDNPLAGLDLKHADWWLTFLEQLSSGSSLLHGRPVTLVIAAAHFRSWKGRGRQFAMLANRRLIVLGSWSQLETSSEKSLRELLPDKQPAH